MLSMQSELEAGKMSDKLKDDTAGGAATDPHGIAGKGRQCPKKQENLLNSCNVRDVECVDNECEG